MKIKLNEEQSRILIEIALKDLLPKVMEKRKRRAIEQESQDKQGGKQ